LSKLKLTVVVNVDDEMGATTEDRFVEAIKVLLVTNAQSLCEDPQFDGFDFESIIHAWTPSPPVPD
jgi:hypothetical protein